MRKPVLSIDLGATYTKVAWRPAWPDGKPAYEERSKMVMIEGETLTPTLVFDSVRGKSSLYGSSAAGSKPGPGDVVHHSWKRQLFDPSYPDTQQNAASVAGRFLGWLRGEIVKAGVPVGQCRVRLCLPAFEGNSKTIGLLLESMRTNGWGSEEIVWTSEPLANTSGMLTNGRNFLSLTTHGNHLATNLPEMLGTNSPLIQTNHHHTDRSEFLIAILDVGSYTTDLSLLPWQTIGGFRFLPDCASQKSFQHGVVEQLDGPVFARIRDLYGVDPVDLTFLRREILKEALYQSRPHRLETSSGGGFVEIGGESDRAAVSSEIQKFVETLWKQFVAKEIGQKMPDWFILTGGGVLIQRLNESLKSLLEGLPARELSPTEEGDDDPALLRQATALGGASVLLDWQSGAETRRPQPTIAETPLPHEHSSGMECTCGGRNPTCSNCSGTGWVQQPIPHRPPRAPTLPRPGVAVGGESGRAPATLGTPQGGTAPKTPNQGLEPRTGNPLEELASILANTRSTERLLDHYTLRGWMGHLVFPDLRTVGERRDDTLLRRLHDTDSPQGKTDWYRLLCLGCLLGAPVHRASIRRFWSSVLDREGFWEATIPSSRSGSDAGVSKEQLDRFFEERIHREFRSENAYGEDAELLRRVFYDFRKMHHYVFTNDLPAVFLGLIKDADHYEGPMRFLKSGSLPNRPRWQGVIGQSMTTPLLFLMREFARIGLADRRIYHPVCFYMNAPARRAAVRLGWLENRAFSRYDFESVIVSSQKVWEGMSRDVPDALDWFDLPLQELGRIR